MLKQDHTETLPLASVDAPAGGDGDRPQRGPAKSASMSPNSIRLKSGETASLFTTMEGRSPSRVLGRLLYVIATIYRFIA